MTRGTHSICAVIVSYHPQASMIENLKRVRAQADALVVVDNGSAPEEVACLQEGCHKHDIQVLTNSENLGIAAALNQGVKWAKAQGFDWVILFDQDSQITHGFVAKMYQTWLARPDRERVVSVHPVYFNPETGMSALVKREKDGGPMVSMTSGALMPTWIFDKIGYFPEDFFIDLVDTEYCLRIRKNRYILIDSKIAILNHRAGAPVKKKLVRKSVLVSNHSYIRRYYYARNHIVVFRRYIFTFPVWCIGMEFRFIKSVVKIVLCEDNKMKNLRAILKGLFDGIFSRMGAM